MKITIVSSIQKKEYQIPIETQKNIAYLQLNDLYLSIERHEIKLTRKEYHQLNDLLNKVYDRKDSMYDWWYSEFKKLPNWLNV
jgi:predicted nucleic acid-binding protein